MLLDKKMASLEAEFKYPLYRLLSDLRLPPMSDGFRTLFYQKMTINHFFSSG